MGAIGGIVSGIGNIVAGNKAAKAAKQAARLQQQRYEEIRGMGQPYLDAGSDALDMYRASVGLNGIDAQKAFYQGFQTDPGFQASQDYATRGLENSNAIRGRGYGGNVIAGLGDYLQKNMLGAYQTRQSQLGGLVDTGRGTLGTIASAGMTGAANQGQALQNAGYYQGAGLANAGNAFMQDYGNYQQASGYGAGASGGGLSSAGNFLGYLGFG